MLRTKSARELRLPAPNFEGSEPDFGSYLHMTIRVSKLRVRDNVWIFTQFLNEGLLTL